MADRVFLSNDSAKGFTKHEDWLVYSPLENESSAHGASALKAQAFVAPQNGSIQDFGIAVTTPATSASGFVSGTCVADLFINSVTALTTTPKITKAGSAGQAVRIATNKGHALAVSAVIDTAANKFSVGDQISFDWKAESGGSAAAGAAGTGLFVFMKVRYDAS